MVQSPRIESGMPQTSNCLRFSCSYDRPGPSWLKEGGEVARVQAADCGDMYS